MELTLQSMKTLSDLMDRALALEGEERTQWLDELATGPHAALSPILQDMLAKRSDISTRFLSRPLHIDGLTDVDAVAHALPRLEADARIGAYTLVRELGRGGMGVVWLAERSDGQMKRQVALKLPVLSASDALAERFVRERNILSQLEHPNIARLYDAGVTEAGQPFLALEYVVGEPITSHCDRKQLSVRERLQRFLDVARAVQYAHANLIVHRDLKPNNILVTEDGAVRLLDFGIAKLLDDAQSSAQETELTLMAGRALTLDYASPEQVQGSAIGTASDVYSLGVILYQLLCGEKPYSIGREHKFNAEKLLLDLRVMPLSEWAMKNDAVRSTNARESASELSVSNANSRATARKTTPEKLARMLSGDLDTIVAKSMRKVPTERYATVSEFAADIERHLEGLPVLAQPESWRYRAGKFIRRNWVVVGAATAVACSVVGGLGVALWQADVARDQARLADASARQARDEKLRADQEAQQALQQRSRADREAITAQEAATRADAQAKAAVSEAMRADSAAAAARNEATRADREALAAKREATRADQEARLARAETTRGNAVQSYLIDLFNANSNDQKNAIQVRNLNAKQLLDRGAEKLEAGKGVHADIDAALFRLFGTLYENLSDLDASKRLHQRSIAAAEAAHGKESQQYAQAILELAWVEGYGHLGKRLDLIDQAEKILRRVAPTSELMIQALSYEATSVSLSDPPRAAKAATESLQLIERYGGSIKMKAIAEYALGNAQRGLGNIEAALAAFQRATEHFTKFAGPENPQVADAMAGATVSLRQLLRLTEAEAAARKTVDILRPFDGDLADAKVIGRMLAVLMAERGNGRDAQVALESAYARLRDVDGKPHSLRYAISMALGTVAMARGEPRRAMEHGQRSHAELASQTPTIMVAVLTLIANAAMEAGELQVASNAVRDAKKVHAERGLPILNARSVTRASAELAALEGDKVRANAEFALLANRVAAEEATPMSRLAVDMSKARILALLGRSAEVRATLAPWLQSSTSIELPVPTHGEMLLLAGEAALNTNDPDAARLLRQAEEVLGKNDVPTSPRLARVKRAMGLLAQSASTLPIQR